MKITKQQLKQIIKEELEAVLSEADEELLARCQVECQNIKEGANYTKCVDNCLSPPKADEKPTDEPKKKTTDSTLATGRAKVDPAQQHLYDYYSQMHERKGRKRRNR